MVAGYPISPTYHQPISVSLAAIRVARPWRTASPMRCRTRFPTCLRLCPQSQRDIFAPESAPSRHPCGALRQALHQHFTGSAIRWLCVCRAGASAHQCGAQASRQDLNGDICPDMLGRSVLVAEE
ncbi:hypothetical protein CALVIDRAFT_345333 [Calocera viscosa TUFC12733]|uniref:Uncharacterized protein n=1 Tax=Calocera viscosa (strain TUFC12733) TaxID=1330018 RepID=A0A167HAR8_CALVF|nr:hypothetical protein CALVIDRAFT_345333 [Calocera viscosa TUFC12733]